MRTQWLTGAVVLTTAAMMALTFGCAAEWDRGGDASGGGVDLNRSINGGSSDSSSDPGGLEGPGESQSGGGDIGGLSTSGGGAVPGTTGGSSGSGGSGGAMDCEDLCDFAIGCFSELGIDEDLDDFDRRDCVRGCEEAPSNEIECVADADSCQDLIRCGSEGPTNNGPIGDPPEPGRPTEPIDDPGPEPEPANNSVSPPDVSEECFIACELLADCEIINAEDQCESLCSGLPDEQLSCIAEFEVCEDITANCF